MSLLEKKKKKSMQQTRLLGSRKLLSVAKVGDELTLNIYITVAGTWSVRTRGFQPAVFVFKNTAHVKERGLDNLFVVPASVGRP